MTMTPHDKALKPCPFCGSTDQMVFPPTCDRNTPYNPSDRAFPLVRCFGCFIDVPGNNDDSTGQSAVDHWNRRIPIEPVNGGDGWQPMSTAPRDGKHCILAVQEGPFIYSVQGAFQDGEWNAVHRENVDPLCWLPNVLLPAHFLPSGFVGAAPPSTPSNEGREKA